MKEKQKKKNIKDELYQSISENTSEESDDSTDSDSADIVENKSNNNIQLKQKIKKRSDEDINESNNNIQLKQKIKKRSDEDINESNSKESESDDETESESDDSSEEQNEDFDHQWQELRNEAPDTNEITRRIAVCNMDWDRIRAIDLFVCFDSFKPANGSINSVKIYPSEYGLKRMETEKLKGPPEIVEETLPIDEESEDKKGSKFHREKLRQYQISRLKYYYAVIDCDSPETANALYEQLNGIEYESSAVRFDLRVIPDDVTFDHEPTSVADKQPNPSDYKPRLFVTTALQQVKVDLTWDETDPNRREFFRKIFTDPDSVQNDIQNYLASASSESEGEINTADEELKEKHNTQQRIAKYRELLLSIEEKEKEEEKKKYDREIEWQTALDKMDGKERTYYTFEEFKKKEEELKKKEEEELKKKEEEKLRKKGELQKKEELKEKEEEKLKKEKELKKKEEEKLKKEKELEKLKKEEELRKKEEELKKKEEELKKKDKKLKKKKHKMMQKWAEDSDDSEEESSRNMSDTKSGKEKKLAELALISDSKKEISFGENMKKKKKKAKSEELDGFVGDMNDPRFSAMYTSSLFNMVPSDHHPKKESNFGFKRQKNKKFKSKSQEAQKSSKRARYH